MATSVPLDRLRESAFSARCSASLSTAYCQATCASLRVAAIGLGGKIRPRRRHPRRPSAALVQPPQSAWNTASAGAPSIHEDHAGSALHGVADDRGPPRSGEASRLVDLAMSGRAEIEPLARVTAAVRLGVGPRDDRLNFEHRLCRASAGGAGRDLAERRAGHIVLEWQVPDGLESPFLHFDANRRPRRGMPRQNGPRRAGRDQQSCDDGNRK